MTRHRASGSTWRSVLLVGFCSTLGSLVLGVLLAPQANQQSSAAIGASADVGRAHRPTSRPAATPALDPSPVRLEIPAIDLATTLVRLGLMSDRTVEVPSNPDQAGWFHRGTVPGQRGSAVILGHVDSPRGPAVFARLQELQPGDPVTVAGEDGSTDRFIVQKTVLYANADFPARLVYAAQGGRRLNLVTCGGAYDSTRGGYQSNLVVFTQRVPAPARANEPPVVKTRLPGSSSSAYRARGQIGETRGGAG